MWPNHVNVQKFILCLEGHLAEYDSKWQALHHLLSVPWAFIEMGLDNKDNTEEAILGW